jgi:release factor glutamine methyltransferase
VSPGTAVALLRASALDPLDARVLLTHALGWRRTDLITRGDEPLSDAQLTAFSALERRRIAGEPIAQITGRREFYGLDFEITPDVLIPRPDTELLVETALSELERRVRPHVVDLGTGSGVRLPRSPWHVAMQPGSSTPRGRAVKSDSRRVTGSTHWDRATPPGGSI